MLVRSQCDCLPLVVQVLGLTLQEKQIRTRLHPVLSVLTEYVWASDAFPMAELIPDIAWTAIIPLIARLVWLFIDALSAENLFDERFVEHLDTKTLFERRTDH